MAVYRFRVTFEDNEEVYREIEIKSTQNFEDFHNVIIKSIDFDNLHDASFFISDDYWRKGDEIKLRLAKDVDLKNSNVPATKLMNKYKMASLIDDPHQKFLYIYDPKTSWTFMVELLKILADDANVLYPKCTKSNGLAPKQHKVNTIATANVDDDDFDEDELPADDEAYALAHSEDEISVLEGEEGEEEMEESDSEEHDDEEGEFEDRAEAGYEED